MTISEKEWGFINEIIIKIYSINDLNEMRQGFLRLIQLLIPSDYSSSYLYTNFPECSLQKAVGINLSKEQLQLYTTELEVIDPFNPLKLIFSHSSAYRASDFFTEEEIVNSNYYKIAWRPLDIGYTLFAGLSFENNFLGTVSFYRKKNSQDFSNKEISIMDILKEHLAIRIWRDFSNNTALSNEQRIQLAIPQTFVDNYGLTKREYEVVEFWVNGFTDIEICQKLVICNNTLKKHTSNIYKKLAISTRIELFKFIHK